MKSIKFSIFTYLLLFSFSTNAAILWVGDSPACTGSNVYSNFNLARNNAALNGQFSNEIRMTRTIDYTGALGRIAIAGEFGSNQIIISGGYADCFEEQDGRTFIGSSNTSSFDIDTGNQNSQIILRNLILAFNDSRGVVARGNVFLQLDNVDINNNGFSGLDVGGGATVDVLADSLIRFNQNLNNPTGGGIRCTNANSSVILRGRLQFNKAIRGANIYLSDGCFINVLDGSRISGLANEISAEFGAGIYVDNGGSLLVEGKANRVIIENNWAEFHGGGIYLNGTGFAILENTHFNNNKGERGSDIYAKDSGSETQLVMGRTSECNFLFACSEIQNSRYQESAVEAVNSVISINRTVIEKGRFYEQPIAIFGLITSKGNARVQLNRVGLIDNEVASILNSSSITNNITSYEVAHLTAAGNFNNISFGPYSIFALTGVTHIENSIFTDTVGAEDRGGGIVGKCNLVSNQSDWPFGAYTVGTPEFINLSSGDARQVASSQGVDMCQQHTFAFADNTDIEIQNTPVNENTNPQGMPGESGGLYDAGFDEVYDNIGEDEFLLTIEKEGSGEGVVVSNPAGISCGSDCSEVYFNGTIVTLNAAPVMGSEFDRWRNCPLVNQSNQCLTNVQSSHTIRAVFQPDDLIFTDGFD